ncbi:MAG: hypothetical protein OXF07_12805 [Rhodobacter sp.]|nr:hypothetical protein [Rhodobacter sp.]MCY4168607.1 hypothetical protein [Rhodobacter sp.]MCY4240945.1 hypothetical protein [Rhodobacter sp.]
MDRSPRTGHSRSLLALRALAIAGAPLLVACAPADNMPAEATQRWTCSNSDGDNAADRQRTVSPPWGDRGLDLTLTLAPNAQPVGTITPHGGEPIDTMVGYLKDPNAPNDWLWLWDPKPNPEGGQDLHRLFALQPWGDDSDLPGLYGAYLDHDTEIGAGYHCRSVPG